MNDRASPAICNVLAILALVGFLYWAMRMHGPSMVGWLCLLGIAVGLRYLVRFA